MENKEFEKNKAELISIVQQMADAQTAEEITRHWSEDVIWLDIQPHASKGKALALVEFRRQFALLDSCKADLLETELIIEDNMALVCTIQHFTAVAGGKHVSDLITRQTDCFRKQGGNWILIHQHVSLPVDGEWMSGKANEEKFRITSFRA
ncbi:YybH family protein [Pedobacter frigidisoli]|uniref:YybH family protein n=1 Tax=Pedobacter frigidisoli TaxID=2530455 RepID=UPI00292E3541|nr:nuclear transport factor 2 family protein [Pedobacter frigidisoli]